jgi:hypothetical protein
MQPHIVLFFAVATAALIGLLRGYRVCARAARPVRAMVAAPARMTPSRAPSRSAACGCAPGRMAS